jgi:hypothetical protein
MEDFWVLLGSGLAFALPIAAILWGFSLLK